MNFARLLYFTCLVFFAANHVSSTKIKLSSSGKSYIDCGAENSWGNCVAKGALRLADKTVIGNFKYESYVGMGGKMIKLQYDCANMTISGFSKLRITREKARNPENLLIGVTIPRISAYPCCRYSSEYDSQHDYSCETKPIIHDNVEAHISIFIEEHRHNPTVQKTFMIRPKNLFANLQPLHEHVEKSASNGFDPAAENSQIILMNAALKPVLEKHFRGIAHTAVNLFLKHNF